MSRSAGVSAADGNDALPAQSDVVVIGGGIVGVMTGYHLARRGLRAVVLEKGRVAGEQSSRNWGWIRCQGRDPAELPIMVEARRHWEELDAEAGGALGYRQAGVLYLANAERDLARFEAWLPHAANAGLDTRMLGRVEVAGLLPGAVADWPGAIWTASDGRAEPAVAVPALARLAVSHGVRVFEGCAARTLDLAAGRVTGVVTERGRIGCSQAVIAGGAWSALFLRNHGIDLPQLSVRSTVASTGPLPQVFAGNAADSAFGFRRREDGGYTLAPEDFHEFLIGPDAFRHFRRFLPQLSADAFGRRYLPASPRHYPDAWGTARRWAGDEISPFERNRVLDPRPHMPTVRAVARAFGAAFPALGEVRIAQSWAGMIDLMPDVVPVIDAAPIPGLTIATGMSGHGFGIGPGIGRVVADLVAGEAPGHDLTRFRFTRFADGSRPDLGGAL